ncbi:MAG: serine O-acetyltransferase EpsC [Bacillota bacterium]|nr:serine O-acetyltransferase EpsC [Bacillota bacterium]
MPDLFQLEKEELDEVMGLLMDDYRKERIIDRVESFDLPSSIEIQEILKNIQNIIYPGFYKNDKYKIYTVKNNVQMLLEDTLYRLIRQISIVLRYTDEYKNVDAETLQDVAHNKAVTFFHRIPKIREYIDTDVQAAYAGDPAAFNHEEIIICYPGLYTIMVNRIAHELFLLDIPLIPRVMTEFAHSKTGIDIHPGATIGKYFFIDHGTGIVVGETSIIGENVKVYQGVTIGALSTRGGQQLKGKKRHPTIEDNVTIYSGASILGGETVIGQGAIIGGNSFITKSVPPCARVSIHQEVNYNIRNSHDCGCSKSEEFQQSETWSNE